MKKIIKCGKLFDGIKEEFQENKEIKIEDGIIVELGENLDTKNCEIIDLSLLTVTPGLIDAHVHIDYPEGLKMEEMPLATNTIATISGVENLRKMLMGGFTTVRGMNAIGRDKGIFEIKQMQNNGRLEDTAKLIPARCTGSEGGHADYSGELTKSPEVAEHVKSETIGTGVDFFTKLVRNEIKYGADFIKFMYSGGFFTALDDPNDCQLSDAEVKAIIETTHAAKKTCTAHCYGDILTEKLVDMGIDGIEHGALMTEAIARKMEAKDVYLVPTFFPFTNIIYGHDDIVKTLSPAMQRKLNKYKPMLTESRKVILNSNLRLGYGSDIVGTIPVSDCWREYGAWIESGAEPLRILKSATYENARILGKENEIGTIELGKCADISGFSGDLNRVEGIKTCNFVMKDGIVFKK